MAMSVLAPLLTTRVKHYLFFRGFGTQMINTPMVIMWPNADGTVTLSQRQAGGYSMPTVVNAPPRVATLQSTLSTASSPSLLNA
jgi:hypothetical protein